MKLGLQISSFTWPGGAEGIGPTLTRIVRTADEAGFDSLWLMDHLFQIQLVGAPEEPMLEGWTTLGHMAANTSRATLGLMVGGVHHRAPGVWVKAATTLDVLSGGRAWLGIGAGSNEEEARGLGLAFPPLAERFELLEDTLQMAHSMWEGSAGNGAAFHGRHVHAHRLLNSPQSLSRPRVPIMVGGNGERRTLRLVARYADATNVVGEAHDLRRKFSILREHCEAIGRPFDEIQRTTLQSITLREGSSSSGMEPGEIIDQLGLLADVGVQHVIVHLRNVSHPDTLERFVDRVLPLASGLGVGTPSIAA